ncbi:MAG: PKD domain-containing protein [Nocardioides sp.]
MLARARLRRGLLVSAIGIAGLLAPMGEVVAAPTWLPAGAVAPATTSGEVGAVDVDPSGNSVAVWVQDTQVVASSRPAGGTWSPPAALSAPGAPGVHPQVALDGGRATAVWFRATGPGTYGLQSSTRSVGGAWTAPTDLPGTTTAAAQASLVLRPGSTAVVAWPRLVGGSWSMSAAIRATSGAWGAPVDLAAGSTVMPGPPRMGIDGSGVTTAVWSGSDGGRWTVRSASTPLTGAWSAPVTLSSTDQDAVDPDVAVAGNGTVVATWSRRNGDLGVAQSSTRPAQQNGWTAPVELSVAGLSADEVEVATNDFGNRFVATWTATPSSGPSLVQAAVLEAGLWRSAVTLSDASTASSHPTAVVAATRPATVTWLGTSGLAHVVQGAVLPAYATSFGPAVGLSPPDREAGPPRLAASRSGDVLVLWGETGPSGFQPGYAAYDVAGPSLRTFHRAGHAIAGHPATFQATAVDAWSPVATYSWSFGDGTTAEGPTASHTYAAPGRYAVRFRVTDAVGNVTTRVARTKVGDAPSITGFTLLKHRITLSEKVRMRMTLNIPAKVKLVLRSKDRHRVHGVLHRQKLVLRRDLRAGRSTVVVKAARLLADTWVVTATARALGVDSATVKKQLVVD